ncbi:MAG: GGDEF domain-containing protein [Microthrixaceae bacterium]
MNSRVIAFVIGLLAAGFGVAALLASSPVLGLAAGVAGAVAGVLALSTPVEDPDAGSDERALHEAQLEDRAIALRGAQQDAEVAQRRVAELELELSALTPAPDAGPAGDDVAALTDADSQLFSEAYFRVALDARIASARRHLRPVAIALIDVNEGMASSSSPAPPSRAAESIRQTVRDADTACRLADGTFAIILEDTPENGAVWTVERVRRNLVSRFGNHTMWAGVACYPAHAFSTDELLDQARQALASAKEWKQDRIEVAIAE